MVDLESPFACRSRQFDAPLTHQRKLIRMGTSHTSPGKPNSSGLDLEKHLASGRGRTFFLTSLLIELIDIEKDFFSCYRLWLLKSPHAE